MYFFDDHLERVSPATAQRRSEEFKYHVAPLRRRVRKISSLPCLHGSAETPSLAPHSAPANPLAPSPSFASATTPSPAQAWSAFPARPGPILTHQQIDAHATRLAAALPHGNSGKAASETPNPHNTQDLQQTTSHRDATTPHDAQ